MHKSWRGEKMGELKDCLSLRALSCGEVRGATGLPNTDGVVPYLDSSSSRLVPNLYSPLNFRFFKFKIKLFLAPL